jgi:small-conductance mechanosensitive channel
MLDLTWWQVLGLLVAAAASIVGGHFLGLFIHRTLYRRVLLTRSRVDDRFFLRVEAPFQVAAGVLVWQALLCFFELPVVVNAFCRNVGHIGLLVALGWAAMRTVDTGIEHVSTQSHWITDQRLSRALLPLARRIAKLVVGVLVAVMVLARMGYAVGPLLVVLAIVGACFALAAHRPLENVLAAYAILGDHGIREGDLVTLDFGVTGRIERIGLYSTRLRTPDGSDVIVPNRKLADAQIERPVQRSTTRPLAVVSATGGDGSTRTAGGLS